MNTHLLRVQLSIILLLYGCDTRNIFPSIFTINELNDSLSFFLNQTSESGNSIDDFCYCIFADSSNVEFALLTNNTLMDYYERHSNNYVGMRSFCSKNIYIFNNSSAPSIINTRSLNPIKPDIKKTHDPWECLLLPYREYYIKDNHIRLESSHPYP